MNLSTVLRTGTLTLSTVALLGVSTGAAAATSDPSEMRGFNSCVAAFNAADDANNLSGVTLPRVYYITKRADSRTYYVNATGWQNGERVEKRITCETSRTGRIVHSMQTADGRYARNTGNRLSVAER